MRLLREMLGVPALGMLGLLLIGPDLGAMAQAPGDWQGMLNRVNRLQEQIYDLRDAQAAGATQLPGGAVTSGDPATEASLSLRMNDLEQQMRILTGQIEQIGFQMQQLQEQLNRFSNDVEFRFQQMGSGKQGSVLPPASGNQTASIGNSGSSLAPSSLDPNLAATVKPLGSMSVASAPEGSSLVPESVTSVPVQGAGPSGLYEESHSKLLRRQFESAEVGFRQFLKKYPKHKLAGNAQYWLGETYYARQRWTSAAKAFLTGYKKYSRSAKAPDSLVKLGMTLGRMGEKNKACATFRQAKKQFPKARSVLKIAAREQSRAGC